MDNAKIREIRERKHLSQAEAARLAGFSDRAKWNRIERGHVTNLTIETLDKIAAALGVKARDLLK